MANSTTTLDSIVTYVKTFPELLPCIQTTAGGASLQPALTIATDVMIEMISQAFNWKWNRFNLPFIYTNSYQQDYALGIVNLGWLEHGFLVDINNSAVPLPRWPLETVKDLEATSQQYGRPGQVCWLPNDQLIYGTWGAQNPGITPPNMAAGIGPNPQPNQYIGTPISVTATPANPYLQVKDPNGNLWVVTQYGQTGSYGGSEPQFTQPSWPNPVTYPTPLNPNAVATTLMDGTVQWTAVNPKGQGIRINPIPPESGVVFQLNLVGQNKAGAFSGGPFTSLFQTIEPIPDDFAKWYRDGFVAFTYEHSPSTNIRAKAMDAKAKWMASLMNARTQGDRERDNMGFYPSTDILQQPFSIFPGPAFPYNLPWG